MDSTESTISSNLTFYKIHGKKYFAQVEEPLPPQGTLTQLWFTMRTCIFLEDTMENTKMTFTNLTFSQMNGAKSSMKLEYGQKLDTELTALCSRIRCSYLVDMMEVSSLMIFTHLISKQKYGVKFYKNEGIFQHLEILTFWLIMESQFFCLEGRQEIQDRISLSTKCQLMNGSKLFIKTESYLTQDFVM